LQFSDLIVSLAEIAWKSLKRKELAKQPLSKTMAALPAAIGRVICANQFSGWSEQDRQASACPRPANLASPTLRLAERAGHRLKHGQQTLFSRASWACRVCVMVCRDWAALCSRARIGSSVTGRMSTCPVASSASTHSLTCTANRGLSQQAKSRATRR